MNLRLYAVERVPHNHLFELFMCRTDISDARLNSAFQPFQTQLNAARALNLCHSDFEH